VEQSAIVIARKQRYIYLLSQVKNNKPLTRTELNELQNYEKENSEKK
jgi:hypothetical protein